MLVDRGGRYRTRREMRSIAAVRTAVTVVTMPWHGADKPVVVAHVAARLPSGGTVAIVSNIPVTATVIGIGPVGVARGCVSARSGGPTDTGHTKNRDDGEGDGGEGLVHDRFLSECLAACGNAPFAAVHLFRRNDFRWRYATGSDRSSAIRADHQGRSVDTDLPRPISFALDAVSICPVAIAIARGIYAGVFASPAQFAGAPIFCVHRSVRCLCAGDHDFGSPGIDWLERFCIFRRKV